MNDGSLPRLRVFNWAFGMPVLRQIQEHPLGLVEKSIGNFII
jgi:hypothetical protein